MPPTCLNVSSMFQTSDTVNVAYIYYHYHICIQYMLAHLYLAIVLKRAIFFFAHYRKHLVAQWLCEFTCLSQHMLRNNSNHIVSALLLICRPSHSIWFTKGTKRVAIHQQSESLQIRSACFHFAYPSEYEGNLKKQVFASTWLAIQSIKALPYSLTFALQSDYCKVNIGFVK